MLLSGPIDASKTTTHNDFLSSSDLTGADGEVPSRLLTDGALMARLPVAAQGTSTNRRETLVSSWPSARASEIGVLPATVGNTKDDQ
jgi:hypothetical protein